MFIDAEESLLSEKYYQIPVRITNQYKSDLPYSMYLVLPNDSLELGRVTL